MKKIVIIGNSAAGIAAAEAIRGKDKESKVSVISAEPFMPYYRTKILQFLEGKIKERDLFFRSQDFYQNNSIELLSEKEVIEVNLNKKKLFFKEKDFIEFDALIIATGRAVKLPDIRGIQKQGVLGLNGLKEIKFILENLPIAHTVIVVGSGTTAAETARIISAKKIEVKLFGALSEPLEGVEVVSDNPIVEILGEGEVKAVRLSNQKVIGASLVIFTEPKEPNIDFLKDTEIKINKGILVDDAMRTNIPFVFAAGDACYFLDKEKLYRWESALKEGQTAGEMLCQM